ncbi:transposase [Streptomyces afghaniensis]|uniref:transposase n=1 Tax=Streptomyces afghaniensis TaxID=66865 RepID=UPI0037B3E78A
MTDVFGVPVSRNTLLRLIASLPDPPIAMPRVVGVGEYAQRKGRIYGTVLLDVEMRRPIDLLPDREADTLAAWLAERPGIEIVCRDRAPFYAEGATRGAPQVLQVADRWHLWHNLGEGREVRIPAPRLSAPYLDTARRTGGGCADCVIAVADGPPLRRTHTREARRNPRAPGGRSQQAVRRRQLGMSLNTILRFSRAATPEELFTGQWQSRATRLDAYKPYLDQRWREGCTNAWRMWEEIREQG